MISVVVATLNDEAHLARALEPLVPAAISGLVREVIVCDGGSTDATLEIADDAGARIVRGEGDRMARALAGVEAAKGTWLLLLDPRGWLEPAWKDVAAEHIQMFPGQGGYFPSASGGLMGRLTRTRDDALLLPAGASLKGAGARRLKARLFLANPRP